MKQGSSREWPINSHPAGMTIINNAPPAQEMIPNDPLIRCNLLMTVIAAPMTDLLVLITTAERGTSTMTALHTLLVLPLITTAIREGTITTAETAILLPIPIPIPIPVILTPISTMHLLKYDLLLVSPTNETENGEAAGDPKEDLLQEQEVGTMIKE